MKSFQGLLLPALLAWAAAVAAKNNGPLVETTPFNNDLVNLMYFDDSGVALVQELETGDVWRSQDAGKGWRQIKELHKALRIVKNPFDNQVAIVLGEQKHWVTYDQGDHWNSFETKFAPTPNVPVGWHAGDSKKVLINEMEDCFTAPCLGRTYYTADGFKSDLKVLVDHRRMCQWARGSERFLHGQDKHALRILCITRGKYSDRSKDFRLLISDK